MRKACRCSAPATASLAVDPAIPKSGCPASCYPSLCRAIPTTPTAATTPAANRTLLWIRRFPAKSGRQHLPHCRPTVRAAVSCPFPAVRRHLLPKKPSPPRRPICCLTYRSANPVRPTHWTDWRRCVSTNPPLRQAVPVRRLSYCFQRVRPKKPENRPIHHQADFAANCLNQKPLLLFLHDC